MNTDLSGIPVFVAVVECGNFGGGGGGLHVTRSAVGKTVARLEARLGAALQRTTRSQTLTEEGELFYLQCRQALDSESARRRMKSIAAKCGCKGGCGSACRCCLANAAYPRFSFPSASAIRS